jgi:DNA-binding transcriptional LysR family regulator
MEDRLQKFAKLVEAGSFTKAAARLHISQPALTTAVKKLERELKAQLVSRHGHNLAITGAGRAAYRAAKEMSVQTQNLKLRISELANDKVSLNIGMIDGIADLLFVKEDNLPKLEQGAHLSLVVDNSARLISYVGRDDLDVAFVTRPPALPAGLSSEYLGDEPLVLVSQASHASLAKTGIQGGKLEHFLSYNQNAQTYGLVTSHFARQSIKLHPTFYSTSPEIMLQLTLTHQATAVLPYLLVKPYLQKGKLVRVMAGKESVIPRQIVAVRRTGRTLPPQADTLMVQARDHLDRLINEAKSVSA